MSDRVRRHVLVTGRVQAVGFRYSAAREAENLGLAGWVRNRFSGTEVELEIEGAAESVEAMTAWLRRGPRWSRVEAVEATDIPPVGETSFSIQSDA